MLCFLNVHNGFRYSYKIFVDMKITIDFYLIQDKLKTENIINPYSLLAVLVKQQYFLN